MTNRFVDKIVKEDPMKTLKELIDRAKVDPEFSKNLSKAMYKTRMAGTTKQKALD